MDTMQAEVEQDEIVSLAANFPSRVIVALEHLTNDERTRVITTVNAFTHHEVNGTPIPGSSSHFVLHAAPEVRVIVRRVAGGSVEVEDVVRPATLKAFADAL